MHKTINNLRACRGVISPVAMGRSLVRATRLSKSLSAQSLIMQPALRMKKVPKAKASTSGHSGWPLVAIHIAHRVG